MTNIPYEIFDKINNQLEEWFLKMNYTEQTTKLNLLLQKKNKF